MILPDEVKELIKEGKILFDVGQRIASIKDEETKIKVAKSIIGLSNYDARELIQFAKKYPNASLDEFKNRILNSKYKTEKLHLAIIPLDDNTHKALEEIAEIEKLSIERIILNIVDEWFERRGQQ